jgi:hypothetical protein
VLFGTRIARTANGLIDKGLAAGRAAMGRRM